MGGYKCRPETDSSRPDDLFERLWDGVYTEEQSKRGERAYADSHLERLTSQTMESIETSSLHLDLISDLKRINSHICSIAYPILEQAGVLAKTRLKEPEQHRTPGRGRGRAAANGKAANGKASNGEPETAEWQKRKPHSA